MNKKLQKEFFNLLKEDWKDMKGLVIIGLWKNGDIRSTPWGPIGVAELVGLAEWFRLSVQDDIRERSWRHRDDDKAPLGGQIV